MTDRELLELAAKAAKYDHHEYVESDYRDGRKVTGHYDSLLEVCLNPLTNDGDAFRLMVGLKLELVRAKWPSGVRYVSCHREWCSRDSMYYDVGTSLDDGDECAATRRAIVRAAAEIGKAIPSQDTSK